MSKLPDAPLRYRLFVLTVWQGEQDSPGEPGPWRFSLADPRTGGRRGFRSLDQLKRYLDDWIETLPDLFSQEKESLP